MTDFELDTLFHNCVGQEFSLEQKKENLFKMLHQIPNMNTRQHKLISNWIIYNYELGEKPKLNKGNIC